jgi:RinA family phage transcriptional activator
MFTITKGDLYLNTNKQYATNNRSEKTGHFHWYTIVGDSTNYPSNYHVKINDRHVAYLKPLKIISDKHLVYFGQFTEKRMLQFIDSWIKQDRIERRG